MNKSSKITASELVLSAIFFLQQKNGVSAKDITKFICEKRGCKQSDLRNEVKRALERATENGIFSKKRGLYRIESGFGKNKISVRVKNSPKSKKMKKMKMSNTEQDLMLKNDVLNASLFSGPSFPSFPGPASVGKGPRTAAVTLANGSCCSVRRLSLERLRAQKGDDDDDEDDDEFYEEEEDDDDDVDYFDDETPDTRESGRGRYGDIDPPKRSLPKRKVQSRSKSKNSKAKKRKLSKPRKKKPQRKRMQKKSRRHDRYESEEDEDMLINEDVKSERGDDLQGLEVELETKSDTQNTDGEDDKSTVMNPECEEKQGNEYSEDDEDEDRIDLGGEYGEENGSEENDDPSDEDPEDREEKYKSDKAEEQTPGVLGKTNAGDQKMPEQKSQGSDYGVPSPQGVGQQEIRPGERSQRNRSSSLFRTFKKTEACSSDRRQINTRM